MSSEPDAAYRRFAADVGPWRGREQLPDPQGGGEVLAEAWSHARLICQERILITEYRQTVDDEVVMEGHSVTTWAPSLDAVVMYFFDGSGEPPSVYRGGYQGDALVLEGPGPEGSRIRHRTTHPAPDRIRTISTMSFDGGGTWMEIFQGEYERDD